MQKRTFIQLAVASYLLTLAKVSLSEEKKPLRIATMEGNDILNHISGAILKHAYQQLSIPVTILSMPSDRALHQANDGDVDGVLFRVQNIDKNFPNLQIVPVPLMTIEFAVFSVHYSFVVDSWESLAPYKIGLMRGIKFIEEKTKGMESEDAPNLKSAFRKLMLGRSDIVVCEKLTGLSIIKELNLKKVKMLPTLLPIFPVFHFLHKKNSAHIPKLTEILNGMTQDKTIDKIRLSVLNQLKHKP